MKTALHILFGISLLTVVFSLLLVMVNTHPPRYALQSTPSELHADYEDVSFVTDDSLTLRGWLIKPPVRERVLPGIIVCHGQGANRSDFTDLAVELSRRGYYILTFDFRAHGESGGMRSSLGYHEQKDIRAALRYLRSRPEVDGARIGIFGFSLGGAAAILTAAGTGQFAAVVADSAFASLRDQARQAITTFYHLPSIPFLSLSVLGYEVYFQTNVRNIDPAAVIGKVSPTPVLLIAGEGDDLIPAENGRRLFAAAREPKELWLITVSGHGGTVSAAGARYGMRIGAFFDTYLKAPVPAARGFSL